MSDLPATKRKGITFGRAVATVSAVSVLEAPFPALRTIHWTPQGFTAQGNGQGDESGPTAIVITQEVLLAVNRHAAQNLERELGGFLLGNRYRCSSTHRSYVIIDQYMEADYTEGTKVSLNFTNESWAQLNDQLSGKFLGKLLVGWYHSHPRMNVFLSSHDVTIHETRFREAWNLALVLEPANHLGGFFIWQDGKLDPHHYGDFYELLEGDSRETVVAWSNYIGIDHKNNQKPNLKRLNTRTAPNFVATSSGETKVSAATEAEAASFMDRLPVWLRGTRGYVALGVVAILAFIATFSLIIYFISPGKPRTNTNLANNLNPQATTEQNADTTALDALQLSLLGKPVVDPRADTFKVELKASNMPERVVHDVLQDLRVTIDDQEAAISPMLVGGDAFSYAARTNLRDKLEDLKATNRAQQVSIKSFFQYGASEIVIEKILELKPLTNKKTAGAVDVVEKGGTRTKKQVSPQKQQRPKANNDSDRTVKSNIKPPQNGTNAQQVHVDINEEPPEMRAQQGNSRKGRDNGDNGQNGAGNKEKNRSNDGDDKSTIQKIEDGAKNVIKRVGKIGKRN
jgi:proteasome lid subunit RPN8/RPN11